MWTHSLKALQANILKTALIFLSLTIAITSVFLITAISNGIVSSYSTILRSDGDLIITQKSISDTFFSAVDDALMPKISQIKGVKRVTAMIVGASPVETLPIVSVYGLSKERMQNYKLIEGRYPKEGEVIVGKSIAPMLNSPTIHIGNMELNISGVFDSDIGFESGGVILTLKDAGELFNKKASMIFVDLDKGVESANIISKISKLSSDIDVKTTDSFVKNYHQFKIIQTSADIISLIALLMGLISIASIMSITMIERKYEFGILRALGYSRGAITARILFETVIISMISYLFALILSLVILWILKHTPALQGYIDGEITLYIATKVGIATVVITILGAVIPAYRASGIEPMELINRGSRA